MDNEKLEDTIAKFIKQHNNDTFEPSGDVVDDFIARQQLKQQLGKDKAKFPSHSSVVYASLSHTYPVASPKQPEKEPRDETDKFIQKHTTKKEEK